MITVSTDTTSINYISRLPQIDSWKILDHSSRVVSSGLTNIFAVNNRIIHSGLTFNFQRNGLYTYKSYYGDKLANQTLLKYSTNDREFFYVGDSTTNIFITKEPQITGTTLTAVTYYTRFLHVDKYEILDHNSRVLFSGLTNLDAVNNKITHNLTYNFKRNLIYTYKSYYLDGDVYKLANQSLIKISTNDREAFYTQYVKGKNIFIVRPPKIIMINYDGGSATYVNEDFILDGGSATYVNEAFNIDSQYATLI